MIIQYLLDRQYKVHFYKKDALIYKAQTMPKFVYFIVKGKVKMVTSNMEGDEFIQGIFSETMYFGEPALLLDKLYLADTIALEPCEIIKVNKVDFLSIIDENKAFSQGLIRSMSERLFYKSMMLEEIANERAIHRLTTLIEYLMIPLVAGAQLRLTRKQLGDMTGLRVETVIRNLKVLAEKRIIKLIGSRIYKC